jgi:hypothetical protein
LRRCSADRRSSWKTGRGSIALISHSECEAHDVMEDDRSDNLVVLVPSFRTPTFGLRNGALRAVPKRVIRAVVEDLELTREKGCYRVLVPVMPS